ncbi:MAG TPA: heavy metal translocating P-type ATPase, partial [Pseudolabrys sp.]|nr:heavy metal translocating P-type ATPase [Pseudolabrys sp.]
MAEASAIKLRIDGMDCPACALKIENAMQRLPGVSDVAVSYGQQSLTLSLDEHRTSRTTLTARIEALGYTPLGETAAGSAASAGAAPSPAWWRSPKGRLVIGTGILLILAFAVAQVMPGWSVWPYAAAALVGLLPVARRAWASARAGTPFGIETLMSIATLGALAIGATGEAAVVVFLFALGELLEGIAATRARSGIEALMNLVPRTARRVNGEAIETVAVDVLAVGDVVMVRPGDRIPSDGEVVAGVSDVDEAPVTGEAIPATKQPGAAVYAGSINTNGELRVRITRAAADNTIARIIHLVEAAQASKAPTARFIDRFSRWYTPAAMLVAALVVLAPPLAFGADWFTWIYRGLAVLLIACPCALVISTPAAIASGLASGARHGLLVKGGAALEALSRVRTVAFDKTGTLTTGGPRITDIVPLDGEEAALLADAAAVERGSSHPLGLAIVAE